MDRNRLLLICAALAAVVVVAGGFFLGVAPQLSSAATAKSQNHSVVSQNAALASATDELKSAYTKLDSLTTQLKVLQASVPDNGSSSELIREYYKIANSTGVTIVKIGNDDAQAYTPPASAATETPTDTASASASPSASATATPSAAATVPVAPTVATNSKITAANFAALPVTVEVGGSYAQALAFMKGLHDGPRLFLVTAVTSSVRTDTSSGSTTEAQSPNDWTISGYVYALTDAASAQQSQQTSTSTASGTTGDSSTDTAAGK